MHRSVSCRWRRGRAGSPPGVAAEGVSDALRAGGATGACWGGPKSSAATTLAALLHPSPWESDGPSPDQAGWPLADWKRPRTGWTAPPMWPRSHRTPVSCQSESNLPRAPHRSRGSVRRVKPSCSQLALFATGSSSRSPTGTGKPWSWRPTTALPCRGRERLPSRPKYGVAGLNHMPSPFRRQRRLWRVPGPGWRITWPRWTARTVPWVSGDHQDPAAVPRLAGRITRRPAASTLHLSPELALGNPSRRPG